MPSRKQRRRVAKDKRHDYEFVYVDGEGNELDEVPEELLEAEKTKGSRNGSKAEAGATKKKRQPPPRGARRQPPAPSWERAFKRSLMLGAVVFVLFSFTASGNASNRYLAALIPAAIYTALFIPFTFAIDRFAYKRWLARQETEGSGPSKSAKKR
jgi:hypothetical protein